MGVYLNDAAVAAGQEPQNQQSVLSNNSAIIIGASIGVAIVLVMVVVIVYRLKKTAASVY